RGSRWYRSCLPPRKFVGVCPSLRGTIEFRLFPGFRSEARFEEAQPVAAHHGRDIGSAHAGRTQALGDATEVTVVGEPFRHRREARGRGTSLTVVLQLGPPVHAHPFHDAVWLVLAKVRADPDTLDPDQIGGARYHLAEVIQAAGAAALQVMRID